MKIAVIGGAGVRTPLLVRGLTASDLPIDRIALFDVDRPRLARIGGLAARLSAGARVAVCRDAAEAIDGADFVFTSIRAGGTAARASDEAVCLAHGVVGQETVGAAGFAMAMRNVPPLVAYAAEIARIAPRAWIVNFTNPVGIVTQAMQSAAGARVIGICDTPTELFEDVGSALGLDPAACRFDYFGLNHLGWLREVFHDEKPQLARVWNDGDRLRRFYRRPIFDVAFLSELRLLPTEYLYFYYRPDDAIASMKRGGTTRGRVIEELNARFFAALELVDGDPVAAYEDYLDARNASYMQLETLDASPAAVAAGPLRRPSRSKTSDLAGYDRIALAVVRAIHFDQSRIIPLNVRNSDAIADLRDDDVVEVPCVVNREGARPDERRRATGSVRNLLQGVKDYERLTIRAAISRDRDDARRALAANPLVPGAAVDALLDGLQWQA